MSDISIRMGLELPAGTDTVKRSVLRQNFEDIDAKALLKTGDTMTGSLILTEDPETDLEAATKQYVDYLRELLDPLGHAKVYYGSVLPVRHLWVNGCTIGDADSAATGRANADTIDLYTVLWDAANVSRSQIQLYTPAGVSTTKGASAAADFAAHKRLSLPDMRGRVGVGLDSMGGTSANIVINNEAGVLSGYGGEENHILDINEMPSHVHSMAVMASVESGGYEIPPLDANGKTATYNTNSTGGNSSHNNMQPWTACNYIMRY